MPLVFGDFALDQERRQLLREGRPVRLEPKVYELLGLLIERRPKALNKAQIRDVLWPGTFVSESALAGLVTDLRAVLADDPRQARYIRTVHGFGYAFCAEARSEGDGRPLELEVRPYPGLAAFTEADTAHFFGREGEVVALWEKVERQPLLAVIGPSGAGKTSFLRAGVIPRRPEGWKAAYATPGASPALSLARALTPDLAGDAQAMGEMLQGVEDMARGVESDLLFSAVVRWRKRTDEVLLVLDQFEELFTLNGAEAQSRFVDLIGRLVDEAGLHVVLSLRDDFLFRCHAFPRLAPVFRDLTPLGPPSREALCRALEEPAARLGLRFEDASLVEEMTATVVDERGALPLLAFAVSRLWEERDREKHLLTREAYERIGGVTGALAQHAEATLGAMGPAGEPLVREIFRNLVTAAGTRAVRERDELLSVFASDRKEAGPVLDALVAARLLTEYEAPDTAPRSVPADADPNPGAAPAPGSRIEVVHESLLGHWPRLTRWLAQDAEGALLRDQLRQAARLWDEKGRPEELLWTGRTYREYALWRERYAGGLSATEEAFARESAHWAQRKRRRQRLAVATLLATALLVATVMATLWRGSEANLSRAEAARLLALGQVELQRNPTQAVAYTLKSLERADSREARLFALRVLQRGPTALIAPGLQEPGLELIGAAWSPNGEWLALAGYVKIRVLHRDGRPALILRYESGGNDAQVTCRFTPGSDLLITARQGDVRAWDPATGQERWRARPEVGSTTLWVGGESFYTSTTAGGKEVIRRWSPSGESKVVGTLPPPVEVDGSDTWLAYSSGSQVYLRSLAMWATPPRVLGEHGAEVLALAMAPDGEHVAALDSSGEIRVWNVGGTSPRLARILRSEGSHGLSYGPKGRWLAAFGNASALPTVRLWDLTATPDAEPLVIRRPDLDLLTGLAFDPEGKWLVTTHIKDAALWPLRDRLPRVLTGSAGQLMGLTFMPGGDALLSLSDSGEIRRWSLSAASAEGSQVVLRDAGNGDVSMALDPSGRWIAATGDEGPLLAAVAGGKVEKLAGFSETASVNTFAFSPDGRRVAVAPYAGRPSDKVVRIHDLDTGHVQVVGPIPGGGEAFLGGIQSLTFLDSDRLLVGAIQVGLLLFDLRDGSVRLLTSGVQYVGGIGPGGRFGVGLHSEYSTTHRGEVVRFGLDDWKPTTLESHGHMFDWRQVALDRSERFVASADVEGNVRLGPVDGREPHYFLGHEGPVWGVAFSPDGRWLASAGADKTIRLWAVPEAGAPPFHTLPREELLARLRARTNLRVVTDPASSRYNLEVGPFPGWAKVPEPW